VAAVTAAIWDRQATTAADALRACWAEPDLDAGVGHCLHHLAPALERLETAGLEIGAGVGRLTVPIAATHPAAKVWAVDVSPRMLRHLSVAARAAQVGNILPLLADAAELPNGMGSFDAAWSVVTLQHLPVSQQRAVIGQVGERLAPGGVFCFQIVVDADPGPLSHPIRASDLLAWCDEAGYRSVDILPDGRFPTWRWATTVRHGRP
jgi:SAM-dependent methyltransferase